MQKKRITFLIIFLVLTTACLGTSKTTPTPKQITDEIVKIIQTSTIQRAKVALKTPEEAILHYFEGLAQANTHKIMQACAIDEMSENFKFDFYTERIGYLTIQMPSPAEYPMYVDLNKIQFTAQIFNQVKFFTQSLLSSEDVGQGITIKIDSERIDKFIEDVDPAGLALLKVEKIVLPSKELMSGTRYQEIAAKNARSYGADESTERVVLFSFGEDYYLVGFTILRYGENWKISSQASPMANTNTLGTPGKTTPEEFESMFNGD